MPRRVTEKLAKLLIEAVDSSDTPVADGALSERAKLLSDIQQRHPDVLANYVDEVAGRNASGSLSRTDAEALLLSLSLVSCSHNIDVTCHVIHCLYQPVGTSEAHRIRDLVVTASHADHSVRASSVREIIQLLGETPERETISDAVSRCLLFGIRIFTH